MSSTSFGLCVFDKYRYYFLEDHTYMEPSITQAILEYLRQTSIGKLFLHLISVSVVCAVLSICYVMAFHFSSLFDVYTEAHNIHKFPSHLQSNMHSDAEIDNILQKLLQESHANRGYAYRYHNGLAAISGVPFFFQSMIYEVITPGTTRISPYEQRLPASMTPSINYMFVQNKCFVANNMDRTDHVLNYMFQTHSAKSMIRCPVYLNNGDLFALVGIDYTDRSRVPDDAQPLVINAAQEISKVFTNIQKKN